MKLSPLAQAGMVPVLVLAGLWLGCAVLTDDGQESSPVPATTPEATNELSAPAAPTIGTSNLVPTSSPFEAPLLAPGATNAGPPPPIVTEPAKPPVELSERLEAVVKLAHSGVEDAVILAFIENSTSPFNPTPDQIVYLTDVGLSDAVITALVNHRGIQSAAPADAPLAVAPPPPYIPPGNAEQPAAPVEATYNPEPPVAYSEPPVVEYGTPPPVQQDPYFYPALAPYGNWVQVPDYGYCWQPTVAVIHGGWQPYCDHGHWLYTDCGWYWQSDYSWGWAPFHYGRWFNHPHHGWCWRPDSVWAPAWVAWRYTDSHCGWAPLPPGAHYHEGVGFTYYGAHVGVNFSFGLHHDAWTFVSLGQMHEREVWRHRLPPAERAVVYTHSRPVSNYGFDHHTVVNKGLEPTRVPGFASGETRKVTVRDVPERGGATFRPDRLHLEGSQLVVYRPKAPPTPTIQSQGAKPGESGAARAVASRPANLPSSGNTAAGATGAAGFGARSRSEPPVSTALSGSQPSNPTAGNGGQTAGNGARPGQETRALGTVNGRTQFSSGGVQAGRVPPGSVAGTQPSPTAGVTQPSNPAASVPNRPATVTAPQVAAPRTQAVHPPAAASTPSWNQARAVSELATPSWQRPAAPQAVSQPAPVARREVAAPATTVAPEKYNPPVQASAPVFSGNNPAVRSSSWSGGGVNAQPAYTGPQATHAAPSYNPPAAPMRVAPTMPSYSPAPVQSRPAQPMPSYTAPAPRPAPQAAPAPTPSSNRRQN